MVHGSMSRKIRIRLASIEGFYHDDEPGNLALARAVANAAELDLDVALDGRFVVLSDRVKAIGAKP